MAEQKSRQQSRRKSRDLSRKTQSREPYKMVLIVCEGKKTEPLYFQDLIRHEKLSSVNISVISGKGTDPVSVVETAIAEKEKQQKYLPYDEIYCVIDRDTHAKFDEAQQLARANGIHLIISDPSFEFWYLCHFVYHRAPIVRSGNKSAGDNCEALLNEQWKQVFNEEYSKSLPNIYTKLYPYLEQAKKHAARALKEAEQDGEYNPSTLVHILVDRLQKIKTEGVDKSELDVMPENATKVE